MAEAATAEPGGTVRRVGRPIEVVDPVRVCVRISGDTYDRLDALARRTGESVPALIRRTISALETPAR